MKETGIGQWWTKPLNCVWGDNNDDGCLSEACANCYARGIHTRFTGQNAKGVYKKAFNVVQVLPYTLKRMQGWTGETVFICNMSDLFNVNVPEDFIFDVLRGAMTYTKNTYIILTKRAERMRDVVNRFKDSLSRWTDESFEKAFEHVWFGVTVENQKRADERLPFLLGLPAGANLFLSVEPLLEAVDIAKYLSTGRIKKVICGGESGSKARPTPWYAIEGLYWDCRVFGVQFSLKQLGDAYEGGTFKIGDDAYVQPFIGVTV